MRRSLNNWASFLVPLLYFHFCGNTYPLHQSGSLTNHKVSTRYHFLVGWHHPYPTRILLYECYRCNVLGISVKDLWKTSGKDGKGMVIRLSNSLASINDMHQGRAREGLTLPSTIKLPYHSKDTWHPFPLQKIMPRFTIGTGYQQRRFQTPKSSPPYSPPPNAIE